MVAMIDPVIRCFLVNSRPRAIETQAMACLALPMLVSDHVFLKHDSYLSASALFAEYTNPADFHSQDYVGELSASMRAAVVIAMGFNNPMVPAGRRASIAAQMK